MHRTAPLALAATAATLLATPARAAEPAPGASVAWDIVAGLTTEIGQRLAGSEAEARARVWAKAKLTALGFTDVRIEPFTIRGYVRGTDAATLIAPYPHVLAITALGYSGPTPAQGITADVAYFPSLEALKAAPAGSLAGRIAFVDHAMLANQDGSGYGPYGDVRREGPAIASNKGALGIVIRSAGTDRHRNPHTGATSWDGTAMFTVAKPGAAPALPAKPIPAGAISNPDADVIRRIAAMGKQMRITLTLTGHTQDGLPSGNVAAELPGRDPALPAILIGCHLDSWDLGTGAIDNAAGCAIVTAAALRQNAAGQALRTIRVLWAGSEEIGGFGGTAYASAHPDQPIALAMESDDGADRPWRVEFKLAPANQPLADRVAAALNLQGIVPGKDMPHGGTDVGPTIAGLKTAVIDLNEDSTRYFDIHHTPDDTLDKIDPDQLEQNVAAWTTVLAIVANEPGPIAGQ